MPDDSVAPAFLAAAPGAVRFALAVSVLTKPTALVLLPLMAVFWLRRGRFAALGTLLASFSITAVVVARPFIPGGSMPLTS